MELSPSAQERVIHQFDRLCKMALTGEVKSYKKSIMRRFKKEVAFSELSATEKKMVKKAFVNIEENNYFRILGFAVSVKSALVAEALLSLSIKGREIILMSYFLDMTDKEIAEWMDLVQSTVNYHKKSNLRKLKKFIEEQQDG